VVTSSVLIAGVLLVFCYLIVPSVAAMLYADRVLPRLAIGWTMGTIVSALGVYLSLVLDLPTGATIVVTFGAVLALMAAVFFVNAGSEPNFDTRTYPVQALRYVESHGLLGRHLLADDGTGGYIIIKYWPRQRVFVDDRFDMYPLPVLHDFLALTAGSPRSRAVLDRRKLDVVVWDGKAPLSTLLAADPGWQRVFRSRKADVFVRRP